MVVVIVVALDGIEMVLVGVEAAVEFVVVFVVAVAVVVGVYMAAAFVELVASGDSTWVWVPSIVECMGMAWA